MRVKDIMSSPACTVRADAPLGDAVALLEERSITAAPVVDDGVLVGMVSELDLLRQRLARTRQAAGPLRVREAMSGRPVAAWPEAHVAAVAQAMVEHGAHTVPVIVDEHVVGVVSHCDVLRTLLPTAASAQRDAQRRLDTYAGGQRRWQVTVKGSTATVAGAFGDETEQRIVEVLGGTTAGVDTVRVAERTG